MKTSAMFSGIHELNANTLGTVVGGDTLLHDQSGDAISSVLKDPKWTGYPYYAQANIPHIEGAGGWNGSTPAHRVTQIKFSDVSEPPKGWLRTAP